MHTTLDPITYKGCVYPWQCDQIGHMNIMWYVGIDASCALFY
jgi:acyl-CoA thioester hydrolase